MHERVLHPDPRRPYSVGARKGDDLKDRVMDLALEALDAWGTVADQDEMANFRGAMRQARDTAVAESQETAARLGIRPPFR